MSSLLVNIVIIEVKSLITIFSINRIEFMPSRLKQTDFLLGKRKKMQEVLTISLSCYGYFYLNGGKYYRRIRKNMKISLGVTNGNDQMIDQA